jgi:hypothetical protein
LLALLVFFMTTSGLPALNFETAGIRMEKVIVDYNPSSVITPRTLITALADANPAVGAKAVRWA